MEASPSTSTARPICLALTPISPPARCLPKRTGCRSRSRPASGRRTSVEATDPPGRHPLDNPAWAALSGPQAYLGEVRPKAARFHPDVSPFTAVADPDDPESWHDLAALVGPATGT